MLIKITERHLHVFFYHFNQEKDKFLSHILTVIKRGCCTSMPARNNKVRNWKSWCKTGNSGILCRRFEEACFTMSKAFGTTRRLRRKITWLLCHFFYRFPAFNFEPRLVRRLVVLFMKIDIAALIPAYIFYRLNSWGTCRVSGVRVNSDETSKLPTTHSVHDGNINERHIAIYRSTTEFIVVIIYVVDSRKRAKRQWTRRRCRLRIAMTCWSSGIFKMVPVAGGRWWT